MYKISENQTHRMNGSSIELEGHVIKDRWIIKSYIRTVFLSGRFWRIGNLKKKCSISWNINLRSSTGHSSPRVYFMMPVCSQDENKIKIHDFGLQKMSLYRWHSIRYRYNNMIYSSRKYALWGILTTATTASRELVSINLWITNSFKQK